MKIIVLVMLMHFLSACNSSTHKENLNEEYAKKVSEVEFGVWYADKEDGFVKSVKLYNENEELIKTEQFSHYDLNSGETGYTHITELYQFNSNKQLVAIEEEVIVEVKYGFLFNLFSKNEDTKSTTKYRTTFKYENGNLIQKIRFILTDDKNYIIYNIESKYDSLSRLEEQKTTRCRIEQDVTEYSEYMPDCEEYVCFYNLDSLNYKKACVDIERKDTSVYIEYKFDSLNRKIREVIVHPYIGNPHFNDYNYIDYQYDENDNLIMLIEYGKRSLTWDFDKKETFTYNKKGNVVKSEKYQINNNKTIPDSERKSVEEFREWMQQNYNPEINSTTLYFYSNEDSLIRKEEFFKGYDLNYTTKYVTKQYSKPESRK